MPDAEFRGVGDDDGVTIYLYIYIYIFFFDNKTPFTNRTRLNKISLYRVVTHRPRAGRKLIFVCRVCSYYYVYYTTNIKYILYFRYCVFLHTNVTRSRTRQTGSLRTKRIIIRYYNSLLYRRSARSTMFAVYTEI